MRKEFNRRALLLSAGGSLALAAAAHAQGTFPSKPIRIVHGYGPGSNPDTIARVISPSLMETLGQSVIVEPKPGAGERIAAQYLMTQPADGYTLYLITGGANVISATDPKPPFNTLKDFSYISMLTQFPFAFFTAANSPYRTLKDLLAAARKNPGKLNYAHSGVGNTLHLAVEYLKAKAGIQIEPVAYKDTGQQIADVISGRMDVAISTFTSYTAPLQSGQLRALAVTSKERWPLNPDVPPVADDVPGYEVVSWLGLAAPAGLPTDIADKLSGAAKIAVTRPEVQNRLKALGNEARAGTPAEFRARVEADYAKWQPLAKFVHP
ncbi:MAG: tripartite tricarboxylate transporter substrate-binding protein [Reyranella sp.]|uniref:Bug family tripartite tricarboxylate transporter substrate binding protein n=1 Tax=Reyranella sp. TaxID=1929291 RepID=UPI002730C783|nr:tripartite tricarboxylate transporter substrate-binding protein [Reyranella sp.]MDP1962642.1 tripartite tricarboxylate transporter substrate-binding protein [Reyranella sp.]MDP2374847.1 tripartite tricarboxylate transporter substrate-binding protein [Reyranella sp.]